VSVSVTSPFGMKIKVSVAILDRASARRLENSVIELRECQYVSHLPHSDISLTFLNFEHTSELSLLLGRGKEGRKKRSEIKTHDETTNFSLSAVLTPADQIRSYLNELHAWRVVVGRTRPIGEA